MAKSSFKQNFSHIILSPDKQIELNFLKATLKNKQIIVYIEDNIKIDLIRGITKQAHLSHEKEKVIILLFDKFQKEAQNAMLKLLEEPPEGTIFILICGNKSILLPTILSRLILIDKSKSIKVELKLDIDILTMSLGDIYKFTKFHQNIKKDEAKDIIYSIFNICYNNDIIFNKKILNLFSKSLPKLELNIKAINVLLLLLISIYNFKKLKQART